jgi:hypothetical protein
MAMKSEGRRFNFQKRTVKIKEISSHQSLSLSFNYREWINSYCVAKDTSDKRDKDKAQLSTASAHNELSR